MIPILMVVFAIGGTTFGMAEESLAFYVLIITVMVAAGYDALVGAALLLLGCGIGVLGSTINPFATGIASGFAGTSINEGFIGRLVILVIGHGHRHLVRHALRVQGEGRPKRFAGVRAEGRKRRCASWPAAPPTAADAALTGRQKLFSSSSSSPSRS